jgi:hypothetical protein
MHAGIYFSNKLLKVSRPKFFLIATNIFQVCSSFKNEGGGFFIICCGLPFKINFNKYLGCDAGETWCFCIWLQGILTSPLPLPLLPESLLLVSGLVIVTGCFFTMVKYLFQSLSLLSHMTCRLRGPVFLRLPSNFRLPKWQGTIWESVNLSQLVYWSIVNWDF